MILLRFFNLIDERGRFCMTHACMYLAFGIFLVTRDYQSFGVVAMTIANYALRHVLGHTAEASKPNLNSIDDIRADIDKIKLTLNIREFKR